MASSVVDFLICGPSLWFMFILLGLNIHWAFLRSTGRTQIAWEILWLGPLIALAFTQYGISEAAAHAGQLDAESQTAFRRAIRMSLSPTVVAIADVTLLRWIDSLIDRAPAAVAADAGIEDI